MVHDGLWLVANHQENEAVHGSWWFRVISASATTSWHTCCHWHHHHHHGLPRWHGEVMVATEKPAWKPSYSIYASAHHPACCQVSPVLRLLWQLAGWWAHVQRQPPSFWQGNWAAASEHAPISQLITSWATVWEQYPEIRTPGWRQQDYVGMMWLGVAGMCGWEIPVCWSKQNAKEEKGCFVLILAKWDQQTRLRN